MNTKLGTPYYVPPEVLDGKYDKRCDLWSIGVIAFILMCGEPPFNGNSTAEVFRKIKSCDYEYNQNVWNKVSKDAKNFIDKLIEPNLNKRMTVEQALAHPWITTVTDKEQFLLQEHKSRDQKIFKRLIIPLIKLSKLMVLDLIGSRTINLQWV